MLLPHPNANGLDAWIRAITYILHSRLLDDIQAGRADLAYASAVSLARHVRRYERFSAVAR